MLLGLHWQVLPLKSGCTVLVSVHEQVLQMTVAEQSHLMYTRLHVLTNLLPTLLSLCTALKVGQSERSDVLVANAWYINRNRGTLT